MMIMISGRDEPSFLAFKSKVRTFECSTNVRSLYQRLFLVSNLLHSTDFQGESSKNFYVFIGHFERVQKIVQEEKRRSFGRRSLTGTSHTTPFVLVLCCYFLHSLDTFWTLFDICGDGTWCDCCP